MTLRLLGKKSCWRERRHDQPSLRRWSKMEAHQNSWGQSSGKAGVQTDESARDGGERKKCDPGFRMGETELAHSGSESSVNNDILAGQTHRNMPNRKVWTYINRIVQLLMPIC